ncbi:CGI-121-domain-containing protein [Hyphopichia burtonii NRRL Y-1933]|uniref:EKC/KEOPS complex subunit CGI121 n=1 Tax=Hyphopichia burtonii NRRL Y-1933 TaxID=984485 RepID=A0A1E4RIM3_9ASCO|nr:CGI-121-domain-containing protein [Hyphopichia burtonii NRRL Y-1933]ODV67080.1 CGI-121-domain-containing protein [Hyphopichia burtonii NRRL Y-1933]
MTHSIRKLLQFKQHIYISCFKNVDPSVLSEVKTKLTEGDSNYDFCFLNTSCIVSEEQLLNSIHKALLNYNQGNMRARTLNTEIILSLSPINNVMDALKRFGVDGACPNVIVIKISEEASELENLDEYLQNLLKASREQNIELDDDTLFHEFLDLKKFKKLYKLNDARLSDDKPLQTQLTRLAISACHLKG